MLCKTCGLKQEKTQSQITVNNQVSNRNQNKVYSNDCNKCEVVNRKVSLLFHISIQMNGILLRFDLTIACVSAVLENHIYFAKHFNFL